MRERTITRPAPGAARRSPPRRQGVGAQARHLVAGAGRPRGERRAGGGGVLEEGRGVVGVGEVGKQARDTAANVRQPPRSAVARGPAAIHRGARPSDIAASMAAASATPASSMCRHSRSTANWIRFQMKPGTSADTSGAFPIRATTSRSAATVAASVAGPATTSTTDVRCAGFRKWSPARRAGRAIASARSAIRRLDVLEATTASPASQRLHAAQQVALGLQVLGDVSTTRSAPATASGPISAAPIAAASPPSATDRAAASAAVSGARPATVGAVARRGNRDRDLRRHRPRAQHHPPSWAVVYHPRGWRRAPGGDVKSRDAAPPARVHPRHRRPAGRRRARRAALPRRASPWTARRVPRRRRLLRDQRLPDHLAAAGRARRAPGRRRPAALLDAPGPAPAAGAVCSWSPVASLVAAVLPASELRRSCAGDVVAALPTSTTGT